MKGKGKKKGKGAEEEKTQEELEREAIRAKHEEEKKVCCFCEHICSVLCINM